MSFCGDCETDWSFGAAGECISEENRTCECPEGFNGVDLWIDERDCHVNVETRRKLYTALAIIFCVVFISIIIGLYFIQRFYKGSESFKSLFIFEYDIKARTPVTRQKELNRVSIIIHSFSALLTLFYFIENLYFAVNTDVLDKFQITNSLRITTGLAWIVLPIYAHLGSIFMFLYLPDPNKYGELVGLSQVIVRYPKFSRKFLVVTFLVPLVTFLLIVILEPLNDGNSERYFLAALGITYTLSFLSTLACCVYVFNLDKLYKSLIDNSRDSEAELVTELKLTKRLVKWLFHLLVSNMTSSTLIVMFIIFYGRYTYLLIAFGQITHVGVFTFMNCVILFFISKGAIPFKVRNTSGGTMTRAAT